MTEVQARRQRRVILAICCVSLLLVTMDLTIVNVALPALRRDLHASVAGLQWAVDGYTVVVASLLLLSGSMADRFGRRRVFQIGLGVFGLGSLLCSVAPSVEVLVACRMLKAVGGAMLNPVAMSIVVGTFTDPKERARAIGVWGAVFGVSMAAGPLLGGLLVDHVGWRAIFWVNVPVAVAAIVLAARFIPESRSDRRRPVDVVGQALIATGLLGLTSTLIDAHRAGWASAPIIVRFCVTGAAFAAFVLWESGRAAPLLDLRFFRSLPFALSTLLAMASFAAFAGFLFLNSLYLQEGRGLSASAAGIRTLPIALGLLVCSPLAGRLVGAGRARLALVVAGAAFATGALALTGLAADTPLPLLVVAYAIFGVGIGSVGPPVNTTAVSGMPAAQAGLAAAVASTSRQIGAAIGVALSGSFSAQPVLSGIAITGVVIIGLGVASTSARARTSAARVAALIAAPR